MFARIFFFLVGFGFAIIGLVYIISYLNLMTIGYNFNQYIHFISRRFECYLTVIGLALIFITIFIRKGDKNELHL